MQDTLVSLCAAGLWDEADALIDQLVALSEQQLAQAIQETHGAPKWSSLHYAALCKPTPRTLDTLIGCGAALEARGSSGSTPLHLAAWNGCEQAARRLVAAGARVDAASNNGRTPLMFAARRGDRRMMRALLQLGADAAARDRRGRSALHFAAQSGHARAMQALLDAGAADCGDADGVTAAQLAASAAAAAAAAAAGGACGGDDDDDDDDDDDGDDDDEDARSDWTLRKALSDALDVRGWRARVAALIGHGAAAAGSAPPSPPPSPEVGAMRAGGGWAASAGERPVKRVELYAAVGAGVLVSMLLPMARAGGAGRS